MKLKFQPLTPARWGDLEALFGENGACGGCWCMWWRLKRADWSRDKGAKNKAAFRRIVASGRIPGILAYDGKHPVAWCAVEPRENYPLLERSPSLKRVDDAPVWSITCLFVAKEFRRKGVSVALLKAAAEHVLACGGTIVEGYPMIALLLALALQDDPVKKAVERHDREAQAFEESLVELGPSALPAIKKLVDSRADVKPAADRAAARIEKLRPEIEELVKKLSAEKINDREEATVGLLKIGRPARAYLVEASKSKDAEVALRAKSILTVLAASTTRAQYWAVRVDIEARALEETKTQIERGVVGKTALWEAELRLLGARRRADQIEAKDYFKTRRELLATKLEREEKMQQNGMLTEMELLRSRLLVAYVDRHLGTANDADIRGIQRAAARFWEQRVLHGVMSEREYLSKYSELLLDPDEDLER